MDQESPQPNETCRNCGTTGTWHLREDFKNQVSECSCCGGLSFRGVVDVATTELYDQNYFHGAEYSDYTLYARAHARNFKAKIAAIQKAERHIRGWRVLELGAATGEFYRALQRHRDVELVEYLGVEVSDYARSTALKRGIPMISPFETGYLDRIAVLAPNLIVAWDVWEHLENPTMILKELLAMAAPEVTVALSTVDFSAFVARTRGMKWRQYHPPTHLNYPTRRSFEVYFKNLGYQVLTHRSEGVYRPLVEYLYCVLPHSVVTQLRPLHGLPLYLNTFDTQMVIASRLSRAFAKSP